MIYVEGCAFVILFSRYAFNRLVPKIIIPIVPRALIVVILKTFPHFTINRRFSIVISFEILLHLVNELENLQVLKHNSTKCVYGIFEIVSQT